MNEVSRNENGVTVYVPVADDMKIRIMRGTWGVTITPQGNGRSIHMAVHTDLTLRGPDLDKVLADIADALYAVIGWRPAVRIEAPIKGKIGEGEVVGG